MKAIAFAAMLVLGGCAVMRTVAPNTTAGFEKEGVLGAVAGASDAMLITCAALEGQGMRAAVDDLGTVTETTGEIADIRATRRKACAAAVAMNVISKGLDAALPEMTVHRATGDGVAQMPAKMPDAAADAPARVTAKTPATVAPAMETAETPAG